MVVMEPMEYYAGKSKWDDTIRPQPKEGLLYSWFVDESRHSKSMKHTCSKSH